MVTLFVCLSVEAGGACLALGLAYEGRTLVRLEARVCGTFGARL
jgi:hypothetical protein